MERQGCGPAPCTRNGLGDQPGKGLKEDTQESDMPKPQKGNVYTILNHFYFQQRAMLWYCLVLASNLRSCMRDDMDKKISNILDIACSRAKEQASH